MNAVQYENWSQYYDPNGKERKQIDKCLTNRLGIYMPFVGSRVLEVGCGTGRFTRKIIYDVKHIDVFDPCGSRIDVLNDFLRATGNTEKCTTHIGDLKSFLTSQKEIKKYDVIVLSWSWAYIPDSEKADTLNQLMNMLTVQGALVSIMVEGGEFETLIFDLCKNKNPNFPNDLDRNKKANDCMRKLLNEKKVYYSERQIETSFVFDNLSTAVDVITNSVSDVCLTEEDIVKYIQEKNLINNSKVIASDIVRCICVKQLPARKENAKITFNYKLCDNRGDCSAANECRKHCGAIVRVDYKNDKSEEKERWEVLPAMCLPDKCGKKCVAVCELFSVHRFWHDVFEKLRVIEKTMIEPAFFDKDRFGSGSYNPSHKVDNFNVAKELLNTDRDLQIVEISDGERRASSFDSVLITDLISQSYYDRYFTKYDIPTITEEARRELLNKIMNIFDVDELPVLLIIAHGKVIFKHQGFVRLVDKITVERLRKDIQIALRKLAGEWSNEY